MIRRLAALTAGIIALMLLAGLFNAYTQPKTTLIRFDVGHDIQETARASGLAEFRRSKTADQLDYDSPVPIHGDVAGMYTRPGYEISTPSPLFAFTMTADSSFAESTAVQSATLQIDRTAFPTHERARELLQGLIQQFAKGKWQRYIPESCPRLTGASSRIDPGHVTELGRDPTHRANFDCPLDPAWVMDARIWQAVMSETQRYAWIGDGVVATLDVGYATYGSDKAPHYTVFVEFQTQSSMRTYADQRAQMNAEKRGPADTALDKAERLRVRKILEDEAVKRGDPLAH